MRIGLGFPNRTSDVILGVMDRVGSALVRLRDEARRRRQAREARAEEVRRRVLEALRRELPPGGEAWLIGSLAWGGFGERSDVDLVLRHVDAAHARVIERSVAAAADAEVELLQLEDLPVNFRARVLAEGIAARGP